MVASTGGGVFSLCAIGSGAAGAAGLYAIGAKLVEVSFDLMEGDLAAGSTWLDGDCLEFASVGGGGGGGKVAPEF